MEENITERYILVVDHPTDHAQLIEQILQDTSTAYQVIVLQHAKETIHFLRQVGQYANAPRPHLILLDLNSSEINGLEILTEIKSDARFRRIPIVVLTASQGEEDIFQSYTVQGNCYVIKAADLEQLAAIIKRIEKFWLGIVTLPLE